MRAVGYSQPGELRRPGALEDIELPLPEPGLRDLRVAVEAVSVNPVDAKLRARLQPDVDYRVLGFDAVGTVDAVGEAVKGFRPGERVWYAGDNRRQGCNAEYQLVDERLVSRAPSSLEPAEAAALPLTALTVRESLEDHLGLTPDNAPGRSLLVVGGAGGVGSMAIQIASRELGMRVIATAGRTPSAEWCVRMGATEIVDYHHGLVGPVRDLDIEYVDAVLLAVRPDDYWREVCELVAPFGGIVGIVDASGPLDLNLLKPKSAGYHWTFMFARANHGVQMERQGGMLARTARQVDEGILRTTLSENLGPISAANLLEAHRRIESGATIGKLVLSGWPPA